MVLVAQGQIFCHLFANVYSNCSREWPSLISLLISPIGANSRAFRIFHLSTRTKQCSSLRDKSTCKFTKCTSHIRLALMPREKNSSFLFSTKICRTSTFNSMFFFVVRHATQLPTHLASRDLHADRLTQPGQILHPHAVHALRQVSQQRQLFLARQVLINFDGLIKKVFRVLFSQLPLCFFNYISGAIQ